MMHLHTNRQFTTNAYQKEKIKGREGNIEIILKNYKTYYLTYSYDIPCTVESQNKRKPNYMSIRKTLVRLLLVTPKTFWWFTIHKCYLCFTIGYYIWSQKIIKNAKLSRTVECSGSS